MIDFSLPPGVAELQDRTRAFVRDHCIPAEQDPRQDRHGPHDDFRRELNARAKAAGLLAPQVASEYGGLGLAHTARAVIFEEAGYSLLGPLAMNLAAPDEGNMHLLEAVATPAQQEKYLRPLAAGETRSCFAMTEPPPGAGSDPGALATTAIRDGDDYLLSGEKWLITGAYGAAFAIIMARGEDGRATMFLADLPSPGVNLARQMNSLDQGFPGGHAVLRFENLRLAPDAILGEPGEGFRYAQIRLAPARLTHCMRWLGAARRAHDIATQYARTRHAFGRSLAEHEGVGFMLADNAMDLRTSRLLIWHTAWLLDQGERAGSDSSMAKVVCSEAIYRIADRCVQVLGGAGVTDETVVERIFREVRGFRIYDGPSEVHRWSLAQKIARHGANQ